MMLTSERRGGKLFTVQCYAFIVKHKFLPWLFEVTYFNLRSSQGKLTCGKLNEKWGNSKQEHWPVFSIFALKKCFIDCPEHLLRL